MKEVENESGLNPPRPNEAELQARYDELEARFQQLKSGEALDGCPSEDVESDNDPLSDKNVHAVNAITLMRIYDMLSAILTHLDEDMAEAVLKVHAEGGLVGPFPYIDMQAPEAESQE